jgi:hypothetical protein
VIALNSFAFTDKWWGDKKQIDEIRFMPQFGPLLGFSGLDSDPLYTDGSAIGT